jgi:hypothetical protein
VHVSVEVAEVLLALAARHMWHSPADQLARFANIVTTAGRSLSPEVITVMRRIVESGHDGATALKSRVARIDTPDGAGRPVPVHRAAAVGDAHGRRSVPAVRGGPGALGHPGKAMVLAKETAIVDPTITSQIRR